MYQAEEIRKNTPTHLLGEFKQCEFEAFEKIRKASLSGSFDTTYTAPSFKMLSKLILALIESGYDIEVDYLTLKISWEVN